MKKSFYGLIVLIATSMYAKGQTPEAVASAGGSGASNQASVDWTLGEVITETLSYENGFVTQGLHQHAAIEITTDIAMVGLEVNVYPNPTSEGISIDTENLPSVNMYLLDMRGHILWEKQKPSPIELLDLSGYASGNYLLQVVNPANKQIAILKIVKN